MERFDPLELLAAIERHRVTHVQLVPTHMIRLLKLSDEERSRFDLSSLEMVIHAAAPCPVDVKQAFIEWLGPIVHEFYSGSEGAGLCYIGPEDWLAHPGSVGKSHDRSRSTSSTTTATSSPSARRARCGSRRPAPSSTTATRRRRRRRGTASRAGAGSATSAASTRRATSTSPTGRRNMIISGGVNIYPREIEDVLVMHPADRRRRRARHARPRDGRAGHRLRAARPRRASVTADELIAWCRERLSHFKCPREVRFVDALPGCPPASSSSACCSRLAAVSPRCLRRSASNSATAGPAARRAAP